MAGNAWNLNGAASKMPPKDRKWIFLAGIGVIFLMALGMLKVTKKGPSGAPEGLF
jgi:hypothetical protein